MLPDRKKLLITELPEGHRVVAVGNGVFVVRDGRGRSTVLEQDGHLIGVTTRRSLAAQWGERAPRLSRRAASNPYTTTMD